MAIPNSFKNEFRLMRRVGRCPIERFYNDKDARNIRGTFSTTDRTFVVP